MWYFQLVPSDGKTVTCFVHCLLYNLYLSSSNLFVDLYRYKKLFTLLKHSKQDSASVAPLHKHKSVHQDDPTKATILNEQFQSVFSRRKFPTASAPFVTWNYKKVLMQTDPYLCESINVFASIAQFFFVNVLMNSRIFTTCQSRINKYQNLSIHLQFTVIFRRCMSSLRIKLNATC